MVVKCRTCGALWDIDTLQQMVQDDWTIREVYRQFTRQGCAALGVAHNNGGTNHVRP